MLNHFKLQHYSTLLLAVSLMHACACSNSSKDKKQASSEIDQRAHNPFDTVVPGPDERGIQSDAHLYDSKGELLPSGQTIAGLPLPKGLRPEFKIDLRQTFSTRVSMVKMLRFYGPKLLEARIEKVGAGAAFHDVYITQADGRKKRLGVRLYQLPKKMTGLEVQVFEDPSKAPPLTGQRLQDLQDYYRKLE